MIVARRAALLIVFAASAHAEPPDCLKDRFAHLHVPRLAGYAQRLDANETYALAKPDRVEDLYRVINNAGLVGDAARIARLVPAFEQASAANPPNDVAIRESQLARAQALAGHRKEALAHVAAARAAFARSAMEPPAQQRARVLAVALTLTDDALVKELDTELRAVADHGLAAAASALTEAGFAARALQLADIAPATHDAVVLSILAMVIGGPPPLGDPSLELDLLGRLTDPLNQLYELQAVWVNLDPGTRRSPDLDAIIGRVLAIERRRAVTDDWRGLLVMVLAERGMVAEATAVTSHITAPWQRARSEALTARALALVDRKAAITLARTALRRAAAIKGRGYELEPEQAAAAALARAGAITQAYKLSPRPVEIAIGLRDRPAELAAWWTSADETSRTELVEAADSGELGDAAFLAAVCK